MVETVHNLSLSDLLWERLGDWVRPGLTPRSTQPGAEAEWQAAIATLGQLLNTVPRPTPGAVSPVSPAAEPDASLGVVLSGPLPVITDAGLMAQVTPWVVTPQPLADALNGRRSLLPAASTTAPPLPAISALPLALEDPLLQERFCVVITAAFRLGVVLGQPTGRGWACQYSFDPADVDRLLQRILGAVGTLSDAHLPPLRQAIAAYPALPPDYRLVAQFSQGMVAHLPHRSATVPQLEVVHVPGAGPRLAQWQTVDPADVPVQSAMAWEGEAPAPIPDAELLQAMAHEIRTPLTTIRTLTRSLLRRKDVGADVAKRLRRIDQECTQQIDRFNLIFRAAELTNTPRNRSQSPLAPIALSHVFEEAVPQWQQQAHRRNLSLNVNVPSHLPRVTSDPTLLHQVLTGVVEWFTQSLPAQSQVDMQVTLAGHQLKLQLETQPSPAHGAEAQGKRLPLRSLGQLLSVAPDTGGLSLNLDVTKTLFEALGGKLIVRQRPSQGEVVTVFLPLETREI